MVEDRVMDKWLALEMTRFHRSFVAAPRPLADLLAEAAPTAPTKGGETHRYDAATLRKIDSMLGPLLRRRVRLPVTFYVDKDLPDDAHLADEVAVELLRALREIAPGEAPREGRLWLGHARARLLAERYPGAFQFVYF